MGKTLGTHRVELLYPEALLGRPEELDRYLTHVMTVNAGGNITIPVIEDFDGCSERRRFGLLVSRQTLETGQEIYDLKIHNPSGDESVLPVSIDNEEYLGAIGGFAVDFAQEETSSVVAYSVDGEWLELTTEQVRGLRSRLVKAVESAVHKKTEYDETKNPGKRLASLSIIGL